jgi:hypothetical protein
VAHPTSAKPSACKATLEANTCRGQGWWRGNSRIGRSTAGENAIRQDALPWWAPTGPRSQVRRGPGHRRPPDTSALAGTGERDCDSTFYPISSGSPAEHFACPLTTRDLPGIFTSNAGGGRCHHLTPLTLWHPHLSVRIPVRKCVDRPRGHHPPLRVRAVPSSLIRSHSAPAGFPILCDTRGSGSLPRNNALVREVVQPHLVFPGSGSSWPGPFFSSRPCHSPSVR